jgi:hypothetical protein
VGAICHEKIAGGRTPCSCGKIQDAVKTGWITVDEVALFNDQ